MLNKDVKELYKLVPHGTSVTIVHENRVHRNLKSGDIGSDVRDMQKALKKLGYYSGYPDGKFGSGMTAGIRKFQKDHKLRVTGIINKSTYSLILEKFREKEEKDRIKLENEEKEVVE
jgi:peptidoglycan hydrolase-like protein with peptidoglycan-binding domain